MIPESTVDLFNNKAMEYSIEDNSVSMNNVESLSWSIARLSHENLTYNQFGTEAFLMHEDYNFALYITSYGLGDEFSHGFSVVVIEKEEYLRILESIGDSRLV